MSQTDGVLTVSASQFKDYFDCARKWWFKKVAKIDEPMKKHFAIGTCVHSIIERWMSADETGRMPDGSAVELYPPGWHVVVDKYGKHPPVELTVGEQNMMRKLIDDAIGKGVLIRTMGRQIESYMRRLMFTVGETEVIVHGYIDIISHDKIEDHKTSKKTRSGGNYFLGKKALSEDVQVLLYAAEILFRAAERGEAVPAVVTLRHNQFLKDDVEPWAKSTEVTVTVEDIQRNWSRCVLAAQEMYGLTLQANHWFVKESLNSCNKYGGCPFLNICTGSEDVETYRKRQVRMALPAAPRAVPMTLPVTGEDMSGQTPSPFASAFGASTAGSAAPAAAAAPPFGAPPPFSPPPGQPPAPPASAGAPAGFPPMPPQPTAPAAQPAFTPAPTAPVAPPAAGHPLPQGYTLFASTPWATPGCTACGGIGLNTAGNPCGICTNKQTQAGGLVPAMFNLGADGHGNFLWQILPDFAARCPQAGHYGGCPIPNSTRFNGGQPVAAPAQPPAPPPMQPPAAAAPPAMPNPAPQPPGPPAGEALPPAAGTPEAPKKRGKGRPSEGLTVYVNCHPTKGVGEVSRIEDLFTQYADECAKHCGVQNYFALDVWKRRDLMAQAVPSIVEKMGVAHLTCKVRGDNGDVESFAKHFIARAVNVVEMLSY